MERLLRLWVNEIIRNRIDPINFVIDPCTVNRHGHNRINRVYNYKLGNNSRLSLI
jgi:hypothetical protein